MSDTEAVERSRRRRRSREEADRLVLEYECSGMTREAFCRQHGLSAATLDNCIPPGKYMVDGLGVELRSQFASLAA